MKYLAAALTLAGAASAAPPPNPALVAPDLRQTLQQYHPEAAPPRQLSPVERAELRRQLSEFGRPAEWVRPQPPRPQAPPQGLIPRRKEP